MKTVGIIGGGFAGLSLARKLANHKDINVTLIDRRNHHLFQPLLYQVAMAGLNPSEIAEPFRKILGRKKNIEILMSEVTSVNLKETSIQIENKKRVFDYLAIACGSHHSYFGNNDWEKWAPGLKTLEQATEIRRRILFSLEEAEKEEDPVVQKKWLTFVIVGGGPTGVELAGSISEMTRTTLFKDYKHANLKNTKIHIVEAGERLLKAFPPSLSHKTTRDLETLGVEVHLKTQASHLGAEGLKLNDQWVDTKTILWAAGVKASSLGDCLDVEKLKDGRIIVKSDLSIPNYPNTFVLGDQAAFLSENGDYLPGLAPVALQQGEFLAKNLKKELKGNKRDSFRYFDKGIMATIGRSKAVVKTGSLEFSGFFAWLAWAFIHIAYLVHWKNRFFVLLQWCWSYFRFGKGARLIVNKSWRSYGDKNKEEVEIGSS